MAGPGGTTLVVVGDDAPELISALGTLSNVRAAQFADADDAEVQRWITRGHSQYVVHDRDPLTHVAYAWVEFFDEQSSLGALEVEIDRTLRAFREGSATMPDYYLVPGPESLPATWKHWWLGVLPEAAPTRVIPWSGGKNALSGLLRRLPTGRPWPRVDPWLRGVGSVLPDRVGIRPDGIRQDESWDRRSA